MTCLQKLLRTHPACWESVYSTTDETFLGWCDPPRQHLLPDSVLVKAVQSFKESATVRLNYNSVDVLCGYPAGTYSSDEDPTL